MNQAQKRHDLLDSARILRGRVKRVLLLKAFLSSVIYVAPLAAVAVLSLRFAGCGIPFYHLGLASVAVIAVVFAVLAVRSMRRLPSVKACIAAIDAASSAGGLMMTDAATSGWEYPEVVLPDFKSDTGSEMRLALCSVLLLVVVFALPSSLFIRTKPQTQHALAPLAEKELEKLEELTEEGLVDQDTADEMKEWLEKAASEDVASESMNELLESLDHIAEQLDSAETEGVNAAVSESEALMAAENMADVLSEALKSGFDESAIAKAAEMMKDFIAKSDISEAMKSNIFANASISGGMSAEELQKLAEAIASCSNISSNKIMKLCEAGKLSESQCGNCCGSCTNSAAAALANLAKSGENGGDAAAACLAVQGGVGAPTRGPGSVELTFGEGADASGAKFKDETLTPYYKPGDNDAKLQRVIFTDPSKSGTAAPVKQGELKESGDSGGKTRRDSVLPRHRQAVEKYFGE